jgi:hypothetical protein
LSQIYSNILRNATFLSADANQLAKVFFLTIISRAGEIGFIQTILFYKICKKSWLALAVRLAKTSKHFCNSQLFYKICQTYWLRLLLGWAVAVADQLKHVFQICTVNKSLYYEKYIDFISRLVTVSEYNDSTEYLFQVFAGHLL